MMRLKLENLERGRMTVADAEPHMLYGKLLSILNTAELYLFISEEEVYKARELFGMAMHCIGPGRPDVGLVVLREGAGRLQLTVERLP